MNKLLAVLLAGAFAATLSMNVFATEAAPAGKAITAEKSAPMNHKKNISKHANKHVSKAAETAAPAAK